MITRAQLPMSLPLTQPRENKKLKKTIAYITPPRKKNFDLANMPKKTNLTLFEINSDHSYQKIQNLS